MEFTWDVNKDKKNRRKHGVSFEAATSVFSDPRYILKFDRSDDWGERWHAIGYADLNVLLLVVHTELDETIPLTRILSARKVSAYERNLYEDREV